MRGGQWQALRLHRGLLARGHESLLLARGESPLLDCRAAARSALRCAPSVARREVVARFRSRARARRAQPYDRSAVSRARRWWFPAAWRSRCAIPPLSRWKYGRAGLFLAVSRHVAGQLASAGVDGKRIAVVYDGVPVPPEAGAWRCNPGAPHGRSAERDGARPGRRCNGRRRDRNVRRSGSRSAARARSGVPHALRRARFGYSAGNGIMGSR